MNAIIRNRSVNCVQAILALIAMPCSLSAHPGHDPLQSGVQHWLFDPGHGGLLLLTFCGVVLCWSLRVQLANAGAWFRREYFRIKNG